jgi:ribosomal protein S18 acetylase RimI-like enzyme
VSSSQVRVTDLTPDDLGAAEALLDRDLGGRHQVRMGETIDVLALSGFAARDDRLAGVATWHVDTDPALAELAVLAVDPARRGRGVAALLTEAVATAATQAGCTTLWLVTTNDNLDALRLYQRHGFRLVEIRAGAVDEARRRKPSISLVGEYGIPIHDELVLERPLR